MYVGFKHSIFAAGKVDNKSKANTNNTLLTIQLKILHARLILTLHYPAI
jgi:hypothetical protein